MNKSRPGVCDVCGCAVIRLQDGDPTVVVGNRGENIWTKVKIPEKGVYRINGHLYEDGELIMVRCSAHPHACVGRPGLDAKGGDGTECHGYCVRKMF